MSDVDHKQEAEDWLQSAEAEVERGYHDPFPHEFVQSAALMSIAHSLAALAEARAVK